MNFAEYWPRAIRPVVTAVAVLLVGLLGGCGGDDSRPLEPFHPIPSAGAATAWAPNGEWIAIGWHGDCNAVPWGVYLVKPDGTALTYFLSFEPPLMVFDICWSSDSKWISLAAGVPYGSSDIFRFELAGDSAIRLTTDGEFYDCSCAWMEPLIAALNRGKDSPGIWLMSQSGADRRPFIQYAAYHDFTPTDSLVYVNSVGKDSGMIGIINVGDSGGRSVLRWKTGSPFLSLNSLSVSPDGSRLAISANWHIFTITEEGGVQQITQNGGFYPDWDPTGKYIVYNRPGISPAGGTIRIMAADGSSDRLIVGWEYPMTLSRPISVYSIRR